MKPSEIALIIFGVIAILGIIIISVIGIYGAFDSFSNGKGLCDDRNGDIGPKGNCLIEENGKIIQYEIIKFKGEWRLIE